MQLSYTGIGTAHPYSFLFYFYYYYSDGTFNFETEDFMKCYCGKILLFRLSVSFIVCAVCTIPKYIEVLLCLGRHYAEPPKIKRLENRD